MRPATAELEAAALRQPGAVRRQHGIKFQCPGCAAEGHDKHRDNACLFPTGDWGCAWAKDTDLGLSHWEAIGRALGAFSNNGHAHSSTNTATPPGDADDLGTPSVQAPLCTPREAMIGLGRRFADLFAEYLESPVSFFYFAFIAYFGTLVAQKVTLDSELRPEPRLYVALIGESADTRKSTALGKTGAFFRDLGGAAAPRELFGVGSAEGLAAELKECGQLILVQDELKAFVDKAKHEGSVALPMVSTLFERNEYDNRVKDRKISVRGASLSLLSACTQDTYATMFDRAFFAIGFLNRLWLVSDRASARIPVPRAIPADALDALRRAVVARLEAIDRAYVANGLRPVPYRITPAAFQRFSDWYASRTGSVFEKRLDTYGHRLMVLLAATTEKAEIDEEIVTAVIALLRYQLDVRRELDPVDAENAIATLEEKIRRQLARGPLKDRELQRKLSYHRYGLWAWKTAVANLVAAGEIRYDAKAHLYALS
jgi:hypothetical protein